MSSTATEKWEQTATIQSAPAPCRSTGTPSIKTPAILFLHVATLHQRVRLLTLTLSTKLHGLIWDRKSYKVLTNWRFIFEIKNKSMPHKIHLNGIQLPPLIKQDKLYVRYRTDKMQFVTRVSLPFLLLVFSF